MLINSDPVNSEGSSSATARQSSDMGALGWSPRVASDFAPHPSSAVTSIRRERGTMCAASSIDERKKPDSGTPDQYPRRYPELDESASMCSIGGQLSVACRDRPTDQTYDHSGTKDAQSCQPDSSTSTHGPRILCVDHPCRRNTEGNGAYVEENRTGQQDMFQFLSARADFIVFRLPSTPELIRLGERIFQRARSLMQTLERNKFRATLRWILPAEPGARTGT